MARKHRNKRNGGKRNIKFIERVHFKEKNDATRVERPDTLKKAPVKNVLPTNGITFKVKIRKK